MAILRKNGESVMLTYLRFYKKQIIITKSKFGNYAESVFQKINLLVNFHTYQ